MKKIATSEIYVYFNSVNLLLLSAAAGIFLAVFPLSGLNSYGITLNDLSGVEYMILLNSGSFNFGFIMFIPAVFIAMFQDRSYKTRFVFHERLAESEKNMIAGKCASSLVVCACILLPLILCISFSFLRNGTDLFRKAGVVSASTIILSVGIIILNLCHIAILETMLAWFFRSGIKAIIAVAVVEFIKFYIRFLLPEDNFSQKKRQLLMSTSPISGATMAAELGVWSQTDLPGIFLVSVLSFVVEMGIMIALYRLTGKQSRDIF